MDEASSPPFRGCRVLEVVVPYLRSVYLNGSVARNDRPSSKRRRERFLVGLWVQCRYKTLWETCGAVAGCCGVWRGKGNTCAMYGAVGKQKGRH